MIMTLWTTFVVTSLLCIWWIPHFGLSIYNGRLCHPTRNSLLIQSASIIHLAKCFFRITVTCNCLIQLNETQVNMYEYIFSCKSISWMVIIVRTMQLKYMFLTHSDGKSAQQGALFTQNLEVNFLHSCTDLFCKNISYIIISPSITSSSIKETLTICSRKTIIVIIYIHLNNRPW